MNKYCVSFKYLEFNSTRRKYIYANTEIEALGIFKEIYKDYKVEILGIKRLERKD